jgi:hypothetical protein
MTDRERPLSAEEGDIGLLDLRDRRGPALDRDEFLPLQGEEALVDDGLDLAAGIPVPNGLAERDGDNTRLGRGGLVGGGITCVAVTLALVRGPPRERPPWMLC